MKQKTRFTKLIQFLGIIFLIGFGISIVGVDVINSYHEFRIRANQMREDYNVLQKQIIKREVNQAVDMINHKRTQSKGLTKSKLKSRVYEAYSIAQNIYEENKSAKSKQEIQQMILNALRPIRFENAKGYYFSVGLEGEAILFPSNPEMEGLQLLDVQNTQGQSIVKDMIEIARQSSEGFYEYHWTKPEAAGEDFEKISFIKRFEPYDWFIGTSLYVADVDDQIKADLLSSLSLIRFGKEGYIFINRLNGDALISNGKVFSGTKKLWEEFNENPEKMKDIFEKEYNAALKPEGDYIYYSHIKLTTPDIESPKASFIYGISEWQWLVGAGVYLDDVETDISLIQAELYRQIKVKMLYFSLSAVGVVAVFLYLFSKLNRGLKKDFNLLISFFNQAAVSDKPIDQDLVRFDELDRIAENANMMLQGKILAQQILLKEKERLFHSEAKFRGLVESSSDWIWEINAEGIYTYASPQVEAILGYKPEDVVGKSPFDLMSPKESERIAAIFKEMIGKREPIVAMVNVNMHKDGRRIVLETNGVPILDEVGKVTGYRGVDRDITERKKAEDEIADSKMRYMKLFTEALTPVFLINPETKVIEEVNPSCVKLTGYKKEELIGSEFVKIVPEDKAKADMLLKKVEEEEGLRIASKTILTKKGEKKFIDATFSYYVYKDKPLIQVIATDITERKQAEEELRKSEKKYRSLITNIPDVVWTTDQNGKTTFISSNVEEIYGYTAEEIYKEGEHLWFGRIHPDDVEKVKADFETLFSKGESLDIEYRIQRKDGEWIWLLDRSIGTYEKDGVLYADGVFIDITERKNLEEEQLFLSSVVEQSSDGMAIADLEGNLMYVNPAWVDMHGYKSSDELIGHNLSIFHDQEQLEKEVIPFNKKAMKNGFHMGEVCHIRSDGTAFPTQMTATVLKDENGKLVAISGVATDITERKRIEERLRLALDAANDGLWDWNIVTGEVYFSPRYYTMLGYVPYELDQSYDTWAALLHPEERGQVEKRIKDYIDRKAPGFEEEFRMRTKQGAWKWVLSRGKVMERDDQGRSVRMIGTHVDISSMKESQQQLERLSKDLAVKNEELESIVYTASHDLRSPLINIQGFSGELSSCCKKVISAFEKEQVSKEEKEEILRFLKEEVPALLGYIMSSSEKMDKLLEGLLKLSRLGRKSLEFAELDMNGLMEHIVSDMQYQIDNSGVQLNIEALPSCIGDYSQISQVFTNLVSNSIKYRSGDRPVEIRISGCVEGQMSIYCIQDNGIGILPEYYDKVFDIFHQLNPSGLVEGEGLGLTIVRRILDRHDGKIWLESEPDQGSRFYVSVPRIMAQPERLQ